LTGRMRWEGTAFLMMSDADELWFHAQIEPRGPWVSCATDTPLCLDALRAMFALPIIGRRSDGAFVISSFDWRFGQARVRPIDAALSVDQPFVPGLVPGCHYGDSAHSVEVRGMQWWLGWPSCRSVRAERTPAHR
jgi:hypothetical protein